MEKLRSVSLDSEAWLSIVDTVMSIRFLYVPMFTPFFLLALLSAPRALSLSLAVCVCPCACMWACVRVRVSACVWAGACVRVCVSMPLCICPGTMVIVLGGAAITRTGRGIW